MPEPASRYGLIANDLKMISLQLQVGDGIADRIGSSDTIQFIDWAETWVEAQLSDFIAVPLKATPAAGETTVPSPPIKENYPVEFIQAVLYYAVARLLRSEFSEIEPNSSAFADWGEVLARQHVIEFRSRSTVQVGAGRRRHPNVHMPPNIAPREELPQQ